MRLIVRPVLLWMRHSGPVCVCLALLAMMCIRIPSVLILTILQPACASRVPLCFVLSMRTAVVCGSAVLTATRTNGMQWSVNDTCITSIDLSTACLTPDTGVCAVWAARVRMVPSVIESCAFVLYRSWIGMPVGNMYLHSVTRRTVR